MKEQAYSQLVTKLDEFIRKYYTNQLIRGVIYSVGGLIGFFMLTALIEFAGRLGTGGRAALFYTYLSMAAFILVRFVVIPLVHLNRLGKIISYDQAAEIIGKHFDDVRDKLINTLQLQRLLKADADNSLIEASISQKINDLKPIPFTAAVDLGRNRKYAGYALIPFGLLLVLWISFPSVFGDSSRRIIQYNTAFEPLAPFSFSIVQKLETPTQQDFLVQVRMGGSELPSEVFMDINGSKFRLNKEDKLNFSYTFKNVQRPVEFRLYADGFYSRPYELKALPNPVLLSFRIALDYPSYTGKKDEFVSNTGDITIPAGTKASWEFSTRNTEKLQLLFADSTVSVPEKSAGNYQFSARFIKDNRYKVVASNQYLKGKDQVEYAVSVIPDEYPSITVEEQQDSLLSSVMFFKGIVQDDYGFNGLTFNYNRQNPDKSVESKRMEVSINKGFNRSGFFWNWNFSELSLNPGDEIEYWFEIKDNDGVQGPKGTRSQKRIFKVPTLEELEEKNKENNEAIKSNLKETIKDARQLQKELDELNRRILEKKEVTWQDKKKIQELIDKQQQLEHQIEQIKQENKQNNTQQEEFKKTDERILQKQQELEKLFEQVLSEEMKEKLRELEKMMENLNKDKLKDMIDKMKLENKDVEKELDRSLELFKQLEVEKKVEAAIEKLDKLQEKQQDLANKSEEKKPDEAQLKKEQDELNKEFNDLKKDLDELEKNNKELEDPKNLADTEQEEQQIQEKMDKSSKELGDKKSSKASKSQKSAAQKMQEMSNKMKEQQEKSESESGEEDLNKLRVILENLLQLSFDQERLMSELKRTPPSDPRFVGIAADQKKIKDNAAVIEDSLFALSKRVAQIQSFINREISLVNMNLEKTIGYLAERQLQPAASRQQYVMTSINNLALMLSEVTQQMQQQMAQQMKQKPGQGECKKPGNNKKPGQGKPKPSMGTIRQLQQQLNEQMKAMKEGKGKPGMEGKNSEQLARLAAQQEMLRNEIQKMMNEMMKEGKGNSGELRNIANKMEQTETDIVNKNLSVETIRRQQEILTRLLEAEKAERERELDTKRESNENKAEQIRNISEFNQYNKQMQQEAELLKTISPALKPFYRNLVKEYFSTIN